MLQLHVNLPGFYFSTNAPKSFWVQSSGLRLANMAGSFGVAN
jgi:hypothetical protein